MAIFCRECLPVPNAQPVDDGRGLCRSSANLKTVYEGTEFLGIPKAFAQSRFNKRSPHGSAPFMSLYTRFLNVSSACAPGAPARDPAPTALYCPSRRAVLLHYDQLALVA